MVRSGARPGTLYLRLKGRRLSPFGAEDLPVLAKGDPMIGLRGLLLVVAIILFLIGAFSDVHQGDFIACGLAVATAGLLVEELGINTRFGTHR
jgi:hypothetical protein